MNKSFEFPPYDPEKFPITEALLALYDMATKWSDENGCSHRDNFRFASQFVEAIGKVRKLRQKERKLLERLNELRAQEVILKASKEKGLFRG